jgi:hypothetical protein
LRDTELSGSLREASLVTDRHEGAKILQSSALHLSILLIGLCKL